MTSDPNQPGWVTAPPHCCWPLGSALARGTLMSEVWPLELATTQNRLPVWSPALPGEQRTEGGSLCGPEQGPRPSDENPGASRRLPAAPAALLPSHPILGSVAHPLPPSEVNGCSLSVLNSAWSPQMPSWSQAPPAAAPSNSVITSWHVDTTVPPST